VPLQTEGLEVNLLLREKLIPEPRRTYIHEVRFDLKVEMYTWLGDLQAFVSYEVYTQ
jgi:hypothetical protein